MPGEQPIVLVSIEPKGNLTTVDRGSDQGRPLPNREGKSSTEIEQLRAENARLRAETQRLQSLVENLSDVIIRFAPDHTILYASPSLSSYLDLTAEEVVGRPLASIGFSEELVRFWSRHIDGMFERRTPDHAGNDR